MRLQRSVIFASIVVAGLVLAACGGDDDATSPTGSTGQRPTSTGKLSITEPRVGEVVNGSTVNLRVKLKDAKLVPVTTTDIVPNEGHLHVILDDRLISMTKGLEQAIPDVSPGPHRIQVEFVASDHAPFGPRVVAIVQFEVKP
ncbi:MAG TPA: DUF6130 family protein [Actinomycetota bacterium]|nr:DUF6130 family protein [Actinomycetota bacterium]